MMSEIERVKELVHDYQELINRQDRKLFDKLWSNEQECILISITDEFKGKESIYQDFIIGTIQKAYQEISLIAQDIEVNFINEQMAIVVFKYCTECIRRDNGEKYGIQGLETQVVIKEANQWKLVHLHYSK